MPAPTQISPAEYLDTSFPDLDPDYVHGELLERPMPIFEHGEMQLRLGTFFWPFRKTHKLFPSAEQRLQVAAGVFRVADIAVFSGGQPGPVPSTPPLIVIEVISPSERWSELMAKLDEYSAWGTPNIWLVDLARRMLLIYREGSVTREEPLTLAGYPVSLRFSDLSD